MKALILSLFCQFYTYQLFSQQSSINGVISIFNSKTNTGKKQFVSFAQIEDDFQRAQPTISNSVGEFKLIYVGVEEKKGVTFFPLRVSLKPHRVPRRVSAVALCAGQQDSPPFSNTTNFDSGERIGNG